MSELLKNIDARTRLAGTNKLEILLFTLGVDKRTGRRESFGINVFKVREVMKTPPITAAPDMQKGVEGMVSLRGQLVPVVDLSRYCGIDPDGKREIMIVTEYNGHTQGFLVEGVDTILRLDWSQMRVPPDMMTSRLGGLVTAVTELEQDKLIMMLDVERVLSETTQYDEESTFKDIESIGRDFTVFYADDSSVARRQIERTLTALGLRSVGAVNGRAAWDELEKIASHAESTGRKVWEMVHLVLTDVEMPEMDGYILTKKIKSDPRFDGVPVLMHSSLSSMSNQTLGKSVGVDAYVPKFEPHRLADAIRAMLAPESVNLAA
jgi:two-component system, chemotaxis family, chemotaxis protein CheV